SSALGLECSGSSQPAAGLELGGDSGERCLSHSLWEPLQTAAPDHSREGMPRGRSTEAEAGKTLAQINGNSDTAG
ncbi:unnamed protein product, partial [Coccothraustes coccothraustes]